MTQAGDKQDNADNILYLQTDEPTEEDFLGFDKQVSILGRMIKDPRFQTPFCIGIYGRWGRGKTSYMKQLKACLEKKDTDKQQKPKAKTVIPVWFNPWSYEREEHLIIPFLKTIQLEIERKAGNNKTLKEVAKEIGITFASFVYAVKMGVKIPALFEAEFDPSKQKAAYDAMKSAQEHLKRTLADDLSSIYYDSYFHLQNAANKLKDDYRIVVFIDDLDRCLPEKVIRLLESVKLFLNLQGYLFIIGVDVEVVEKGIREHYKHLEEHITAREYLEKMVQLPLEIPPIVPDKRVDYIRKLLEGNDAYAKYANVIDVGIGENPRALKRFMNLLAFTTLVAENMKKEILDNKDHEKQHEPVKKFMNPLLYVKWCIIVFAFPDHHNSIKTNTKWLSKLQKQCRESDVQEKGEEGEIPEQENIGAQKKTGEIIVTSGLREVMQYKNEGKEEDFFPEDPWILQLYVHLSESAPVVTDGKKEAYGTQDFKPGDMVRIPRGNFPYGDGKGDDKKEVMLEEDYEIDVFPVTNRQYCDFLNDTPETEKNLKRWINLEGSYGNERCRIRRGEKVFTVENDYENHPVIYVSWYGAKAYCEWRSRGKEGIFHLPTEQQWERAARSTDGREYPWGNEFKKELCNTSESDFGGTTEVNRFPGGTSPDGCYDMAGNVWEWTCSEYDSGKAVDNFPIDAEVQELYDKEKYDDARELYRKKNLPFPVVRGGSWVSVDRLARCAGRGGGDPSGRGYDVGFRCARTL